MRGSASTSGGSKGGARGGRPSPYFWTKLRPEEPKKLFLRKNFLLRPGPPLSQGLDKRPPPPPPHFPLSKDLDPPLSTQAIEAWKVKCMTFQVFHDLYIDLMRKRCQLINVDVDVRTLKRTFPTRAPVPTH